MEAPETSQPLSLNVADMRLQAGVPRAQTRDIRLAAIHADDRSAHLHQPGSQMPDPTANIEHSLSGQRQMHRFQVGHASLVDGKRVRSIEDFKSAMAANAFVLVVPPPDINRIRQLRRE